MLFLYFEGKNKHNTIPKQSCHRSTHLFEILKQLQFGHSQLEGVCLPDSVEELLRCHFCILR